MDTADITVGDGRGNILWCVFTCSAEALPHCGALRGMHGVQQHASCCLGTCLRFPFKSEAAPSGTGHVMCLQWEPGLVSLSSKPSEAGVGSGLASSEEHYSTRAVRREK